MSRNEKPFDSINPYVGEKRLSWFLVTVLIVALFFLSIFAT